MQKITLVPTNVTPMLFEDIKEIASEIYTAIEEQGQYTNIYYSTDNSNSYVDCLLLNESSGIEYDIKKAFKDLDLDNETQKLIIDNFDAFESYCYLNIWPTFSCGYWVPEGYLAGIAIDEVHEEISDEIFAKMQLLKDQLIFLSDEQKKEIDRQLRGDYFDGIDDLDRKYIYVMVDGSWNLILQHKHVDEFLRELADE